MEEVNEFLERWTNRRVIVGTLIVMSVIFLAYLTVSFYKVFVIVFIAFLLSTAIRPLVSFFQRLKIKPELGVILAYLLIFAVISGILVSLVPLITEQVSAIAQRIPDYYRSLRGYLISGSSNFVRNLAAQLPVDPPFGALNGDTALTPEQQVAQSIRTLFGTLRSIGTVAFVVGATFLLGFYWTLSGDRIVRSMTQIMPEERREPARNLFEEIQQKMGAFIRGQLILDVSIAVLCTAAYLIIGVEYAIVLGILAGIMETVPIIGPILGAVPPLLITLSQGDTNKFIWVIVASVLIQQVESIFLVPRVMDRAVGVNPVLILVAFTAFSAVLGIAGGILAVPLAAIVQIIFNRIVFNEQEVTSGITGRDRFAVLRYKTQELLTAFQRQMRTSDENATKDEAHDRFDDQLEDIAVDLNSLIATVSESEAKA